MKQNKLISKIKFKYRLLKFELLKVSYLSKEKKGNGGNYIFSHVTHVAVGNVGDTVLSQCMRKIIARSESVGNWNIIPVDEVVTEITISNINNSEKLFIGGGGLFLPDTNKNPMSGWQWAIKSEYLEKISIPIYVFSVGYNYFRGQSVNEKFKKNLTLLVEKSKFFGLRNMGSIRTIKTMIPESLHGKISYQPCTTTLIRKIYGNKIRPKIITGNVALNMAFDREEMRYGEKRELILTQVAFSVKRLEEKGYNIYYVAHCGVDMAFVPFLKKLNIKFKVADMSLRYPVEVYEFYNNMDIVLGMRGHAQMIPFGLNCEIITLGSHDKMKWFLEDIDAVDWYVELTNNPECLCQVIVDKFEIVHETYKENTKQRLKEQQEKLWSITMDNLKAIHGN